ncbi:MAG: hypothetical protein ACK5MD_10225 [Flavobacteriales bacterium]
MSSCSSLLKTKNKYDINEINELKEYLIDGGYTEEFKKFQTYNKNQILNDSILLEKYEKLNISSIVIIPKDDLNLIGINAFEEAGNLISLKLKTTPFINANRAIYINSSNEKIILKSGLNLKKHQIGKDIYMK